MRIHYRWMSVIILICVMVCAGTSLEEGFLQPPHEARPQTWWHWMNGNVTAEGITADLEAMARVGIGGVMAFSVGFEEPGPVRYMSPEWQRLIVHAAGECQRLGLDFTTHNCDGWSTTGGPWITPEKSMQKLVWSECQIDGGRLVDEVLPHPPVVHGLFQDVCQRSFEQFSLSQAKTGTYYQDVAVLAFPSIKQDPDISVYRPDVITDVPGLPLRHLIDGDVNTTIEMPGPAPGQTHYIQFNFTAPFTCRSVTWLGDHYLMPGEGVFQYSHDGEHFVDICPIAMPGFWARFIPNTFSFEPVTARYFRFVCTKPGLIGKFGLAELRLSSQPYLHAWQNKAGFGVIATHETPVAAVPADYIVSRKQVIDLTDKMSVEGQLNWQAPPGNWTILRFGYTPTGTKNRPATPEGTGLECDKLSQEAVRFHFSQVMAKLLAQCGPAQKGGMTGMLVDSWEAFFQNWTQQMPAEFKQRRNYNLISWLPVLAGYVVGSVDESERFLDDFRRTLSDMLVENYFDVLAQLAHENGLKLVTEIYGNTIAVDTFRAQRAADISMGEFWLRPGADEFAWNCKETASCAHVYGRIIVGAESFTCGPHNRTNWNETPYDMKAVGDMHLAAGINRIVFHTSSHQPWLDRYPGMTFGPHGIHFERTQTWWEQSRAWLDYLARCQYLLMQGVPVVDVCYFLGEEIPNTLPPRDELWLELPEGYEYDGCNAEALQTRMKVRNERLVMPDGMSYAILLLPREYRISDRTMMKLDQLLSDGAILVGPPPRGVAGLSGYPDSQTNVADLANTMWGKCDGKSKTINYYGKGKVIYGQDLKQIFQSMKLHPDFIWRSDNPKARLSYNHRVENDTDIYFLATENRECARFECSFRIKDRQPEIWHPDTGQIERPADFRQENGLTNITIDFEPSGSMFVIFRKPAISKPLHWKQAGPVSVELPGEALRLNKNGHYEFSVFQNGKWNFKTTDERSLLIEMDDLPAVSHLNIPWQVTFDPRWGGPGQVTFDHLQSWSEHPDEGIKYYSGTAVYRSHFDVPDSLINQADALILDLGEIADMAEVKLNGYDFGILWKPPYRKEVTSALRSENNQIEIRITNVWRNRLIGDSQRAPDRRITWYSWHEKYYTPDSPLQPAGMIGPVRLIPGKIMVIQPKKIVR